MSLGTCSSTAGVRSQLPRGPLFTLPSLNIAHLPQPRRAFPPYVLSHGARSNCPLHLSRCKSGCLHDIFLWPWSPLLSLVLCTICPFHSLTTWDVPSCLQVKAWCLESRGCVIISLFFSPLCHPRGTCRSWVNIHWCCSRRSVNAQSM